MMYSNLTKKESTLFQIVKELNSKNGRFPLLKEISEVYNNKSVNNISTELKVLVEKKMLKKTKSKGGYIVAPKYTPVASCYDKREMKDVFVNPKLAITKREKEVLEYLISFIKENKYCPSQKVIADHFGLTQPMIRIYFAKLSAKGYIRLPKDKLVGVDILRKV